MKLVGRVLIGIAAVALGTWMFGWTAPAWWGAIAGLFWPRERPVLGAALHGALGWCAILLLYLANGYPAGTLAVRLAGAMQLPVWLLIVATLVFPALLSASAAWVGSAIREMRDSGTQGLRDSGT